MCKLFKLVWSLIDCQCFYCSPVEIVVVVYARPYHMLIVFVNNFNSVDELQACRQAL